MYIINCQGDSKRGCPTTRKGIVMSKLNVVSDAVYYVDYLIKMNDGDCPRDTFSLYLSHAEGMRQYKRYLKSAEVVREFAAVVGVQFTAVTNENEVILERVRWSHGVQA